MLLVERSLCCCSIDSLVRQAIIRVAFSKVFDVVLIVVIFLNTIVIAMEDLSLIHI